MFREASRFLIIIQMQYIIIHNPTAGRGRVRRPRVERALDSVSLSYRLLTTGHPGHARELARQYAGEAGVVVAAGGDGTIQEVARGLLQSGTSTPLGILPVGTGNDFIKAFGKSLTLQTAAQVLAEANVVRVDCGQVRWKERGALQEQIFVNALGLGFNARVARAVAEVKKLRGTAAYLAAALKTLYRWTSPTARVDAIIEGQHCRLYSGSLFLVTAGNGVCSGGGFYLTPEASVLDGRLDVCLIKDLPVRRVLQLIPRVFMGRHAGAPEVHLHRVQELIVATDAPVSVHADGEVIADSTHRVEVKVEPARLPVLVPAR